MSLPARRSCSRTMARSRASSGSRSRIGSNPARSPRSSRRRRSSSASIWARSISSSRSRPHRAWQAASSGSHEGAKRTAITNAGTIPDRGLYGVFLVGAEPGKGRVGELDEEMVFETRVGETFLLGASTWRVEEITHDRVLVSPAPGVPGKMPFWKGETANRPLEFGRAIGALTRTLRETEPEKATALLKERHHLDELAAKNLLEYLRDQIAAAGAAPDDKTIVVERYLDEVGDWRVCVLTPFGGKVHAPWAMAIGAMVRERSDLEIDVLWTDDGIVARFPEADRPPDAELVLPDPERVEALVIDRLSQTPLFAARFREAAARALLLPRRYPGPSSSTPTCSPSSSCSCNTSIPSVTRSTLMACTSSCFASATSRATRSPRARSWARTLTNGSRI